MESIFFHIDVNSAFLSWTAIDQLQKAKETDTLDSYVDLRQALWMPCGTSIPCERVNMTLRRPGRGFPRL